MFLVVCVNLIPIFKLFPFRFLLDRRPSYGGRASVVPDGNVGKRAVRLPVSTLQVQHASHPLASALQHV